MLTFRRHNPQDIALIGCGQFGVATLGFFLNRRFGRRLRWVYDIDQTVAQSAGRILGAKGAASTIEKILEDPEVTFVYIASNHASHSDYAVASLNAGKTVCVEKPVAVTHGQFSRLCRAARRSPERIFVGYNRPFSAAVQALRGEFRTRPLGALSLNCFVSGHMIGSDHWYRVPTEGTRICGNAGHWIDLFIYILAWRDLPDLFRIQLLSADTNEPDDNFSLSIATDQGDIFSLMLTARNEPFEGINETINFQQDSIICKIDDFRRMTVWDGPRLRRWRFWPKDVGHHSAALQPFSETVRRNWNEIETSTLLMLRIAEMVRNGETKANFSRSTAIENLHAGNSHE